MRRTLAAAVLVIAAAIPLATSGVARASTCVVTSAFGQCFSGNSVVNNNVWNGGADPGWSQTLTATSPSAWNVTADMANQGQVISYPETITTINGGHPVKLSDYTKIIGAHQESLPSNPAGTDGYEAAYDIWLNAGPGSATGQEVMVWQQRFNESPAGSNTGIVITDPTYNIKYDVYANGNNSTVSLLAENQTYDHVNLLWLLQWVAANRPYNGDNTLAIVDYGFEIRSTSGAAKTFTLTQNVLESTLDGVQACS